MTGAKRRKKMSVEDVKKALENPEFRHVDLEGCWASLDVEDGKPVIGFVLRWAAKNVGFGEFTFQRHGDKVTCGNECMSKKFIKAAFNHFVDKLTLEEK